MNLYKKALREMVLGDIPDLTHLTAEELDYVVAVYLKSANDTDVAEIIAEALAPARVSALLIDILLYKQSGPRSLVNELMNGVVNYLKPIIQRDLERENWDNPHVYDSADDDYINFKERN